MDNLEAFDYIYDYFEEVFNKRNPEALDLYLAPNYHDDDIGEDGGDHIRNSKEYLRNLFRKNPNMRVEVKQAMARDGVITAFLEWYTDTAGVQTVTQKGIGIFEIQNDRIIRRHTYMYHRKA